MKTRSLYFNITAAMLLLVFSGCSTANVAQSQPDETASITYQTFYDELSPYGTWIDYPGYGHVWNPHLEGDFRPYATNGYWNYTNEGWAWASNYNWGWAPFHYGRWIYDDMYGWLWIPGYDWSPAWVTWGYVDNYYAWAPLMPGVNVGIGFSSWRPHDFYWNVCGRDHIYDRNIGAEIQRPDVTRNITNRISIINNFNTTNIHNYYAKGPDVAEVEKFTNRKITPVNIKEAPHISDIKHGDNELRMYRPKVQTPQPTEFRKVQDAKPLTEKADWPSRQQTEQRNNIDHLPVQRSLPAPVMNNTNRKRR